MTGPRRLRPNLSKFPRKPVSRYRPEAAPFLYFDGIVSAAAITLRLRIARVEATSGIR